MGKSIVNKKRIWEYVVVVAIVLFVVGIYAIVAKDIAQLIILNKENNIEAIKEYLRSFGWQGGLFIVILEMLQMLVVFIPAEFVQVCAGLAFPIYIAVPLCSLGILLGASVIFCLVRLLNIKLTILERKKGKIAKFIHDINKDTPMTVVMCLLYVLPLIPIGAIAYFAASSNISYRRYALATVAATIPSVLSSYLLGNVIFNFIDKGPKQLAIAVTLVLVAIMVLLFVIFKIIKNKYFKRTLKKANFVLYHFLYFFFNLYFSCKLKLIRKNKKPRIDTPSVLLCAHPSTVDFFFAAKAVYPHRITIVANRYYWDSKLTGKLLRALGAIPKSLFAQDIQAIKSMMQAKTDSHLLTIMPEGRLSSCGTNFEISAGLDSLLKKLNIPIYTLKPNGAHFVKPKWRKSMLKGAVELDLQLLASTEQIESMTKEQINHLVCETMRYDDNNEMVRLQGKLRRPVRDVSGLDGILFVCPHCQSKHQLISDKSSLYCKECQHRFDFDVNYQLPTEQYTTISAWYQYQTQYLQQHRIELLQQKVTVLAFNSKQGKMTQQGHGICELSQNQLSFVGQINDADCTITVTPDTLPALAFGCKEQYEFYYNKKLYCFYPDDPSSVIEWSTTWDNFYTNTRK